MAHGERAALAARPSHPAGPGGPPGSGTPAVSGPPVTTGTARTDTPRSASSASAAVTARTDISAEAGGGQARSAPIFSRRAGTSQPPPSGVTAPGTGPAPVMITRAPQASCSRAWSADAVTNRACARYSAGLRRQGTDPATWSGPGAGPDP